MSLVFLFTLILVVKFGGCQTQILCGDIKSENLNPGQEDTYQFTLPAHGGLTELVFSTCDSSIDTVLRLYTNSNGAAGSLINSCDDCGDCPDALQENWAIDPYVYNLNPGESYFIGVSFFYNTTSGPYSLSLSCSISTSTPTSTPTTSSPTNLPTNVPTMITQSPTIFIGKPYISLEAYDSNQLVALNGGPIQFGGAQNLPINTIFNDVPYYFFNSKTFPNGIKISNGIQIVNQNANFIDDTFVVHTFEIPTLKFYKTGIYKLTIYSNYLNNAINVLFSTPHTCLKCPIIREFESFNNGAIVSEPCTVVEECNIDNCSSGYTSILFVITDTDKYYTITDTKLESDGCFSTVMVDKDFDIKITFVSEI